METWHSSSSLVFSFPETHLDPKLFLTRRAAGGARSNSPSQGGCADGCPAPSGLCSPGTRSSTRESPGWAFTCSAGLRMLTPAQWLEAHSGGRGRGPPSAGMGKAHRCAVAARHREAPAGLAFPLTATAVPTADFLLIWNSPPSLTSKRKNKLYLPGKNLLPVAWTIAYNICLFQKWQ